MLFSNVKEHKVSLPAKDKQGSPATVDFLVGYLCQELMKDHRKELFVQEGTV